jgi:hypothetical protein
MLVWPKNIFEEYNFFSIQKGLLFEQQEGTLNDLLNYVDMQLQKMLKQINEVDKFYLLLI